MREESARRDFALLPPRPTYLDAIAGAGQDVVAVGKVADIFGGRGFTAHDPGAPDDAGKLDAVLRALSTITRGLIFANLVDFDSEYGHRRDPVGMATNLAAFDRRLLELLSALKEGDLLAVTADHGNDPTHPGTDHTRERVPLLLAGDGVPRPLGVRDTFADLGASVAAWLGADPPGGAAGPSFL